MLLGLGDGTELLADRACALGDVDLGLLDRELAGVEASEVEKVGRQPRQPRHLGAHLLDEVVAHRRLDVLVRHQLEEATEGEERRPKLVRGVGDELAARAVEVGEAEAHAVEGAGQLADLVLDRVDDLLLEVAARDPAGRLLEPPDAMREPQRGEGACEPGDEEGGDAGEEQRSLDEADAGQRVAKRRRHEHDRVVV